MYKVYQILKKMWIHFYFVLDYVITNKVSKIKKWGYFMKKKLVSLMLVAAMTASLTACGSKKTEEPTSTVHKSITAAEYDAAITSDAAIYKKAFTMPSTKEFR